MITYRLIIYSDQWMWWHPNTARYPTRLANPTSMDRWIMKLA